MSPFGASASEGSSGESISHFTAVRLRVTGSGNLKMRLLSLDEVRTSTLVPLALVNATNRQPTRNCNFVEQRAQLEIKTTEINEIFRINRIILFVKELYTDYPG